MSSTCKNVCVRIKKLTWKYCIYCLCIVNVFIFYFSYIKGYANAKIYKCDNPKCPRPACYISGSSSKDDSFPCLRPACSGRFQIVRHVSFVDCPGHDILMATMLNGAAVMDAALLLIAGKFKISHLTLNITID